MLLATSGKLNTEIKKANPGAPSGMILSSADVGRGRSHAQASSPNKNIGQTRPGESVNSKEKKQMTLYDPMYAGRQAGREQAGRGNEYVGRGGGRPPRRPQAA